MRFVNKLLTTCGPLAAPRQRRALNPVSADQIADLAYYIARVR
jgi:hypothetical protein